jgi:transcriptional regulator with XRE-family HTH domain
MKDKGGSEMVSAAETARSVLKDMLRRGTVSLDEIGRRLGHTRGYMSRALRGLNPLTLETIVGALEVAGVQPAEYFAAVARALAPPAAGNGGPSQARIEEIVLRTLRRLGWSAPLEEDERESGSQVRSGRV